MRNYDKIIPVELKILVVSVHGELRGCWLVRKNRRRSGWTQDTRERFSDWSWMLIGIRVSKSSRIWIGRHLEQRRRLPIKLLGPVVNLHRTSQLLKTRFGFPIGVWNLDRSLHVGWTKSSESFVGRIVTSSVLLLLQLHQSSSLVDAESSVFIHWTVPLSVGLISCGLAEGTNVAPENWTTNNTSWSLERVAAILDLRLPVGETKGTNIHVLIKTDFFYDHEQLKLSSNCKLNLTHLEPKR